jgi:hypothetical protein
MAYELINYGEGKMKDVSIPIASKRSGLPVRITVSNHTTTGFTKGWRLIEIKGDIPNDNELVTFQYDMLDDVIAALNEMKNYLEKV